MKKLVAHKYEITILTNCILIHLEPYNALPPHLSGCKRYALKSRPEDILNNLPMSEDAFICFLHHSYPEFFTSVHQMAEAAEHLSLADMFMKEWTVLS